MPAFLRYFLLLLAFSLAAASPARADVASDFQSMMGKIIRGAPGVVNVPITGGVGSTVSGTVTVAGGVGVATSATARVSAAAIARGAARVAVGVVPWVGTAVTVAMVADAVKSSGITTCPPPQFFCKGAGTWTPATVQYIYPCTSQSTNPVCAANHFFNDPVEACTYRAQIASNTIQSDGTKVLFSVSLYPNSTNKFQCSIKTNGNNNIGASELSYSVVTQFVCPSGARPDNNNMCGSQEGDTATEDDINDILTKKANQDYDWAVKTQTEMARIANANPGLQTPIDYSKVPVDVNAPQTSGPETVVSTKTIPNSDGSTSTETVTQKVVVTPTVGASGTVTDPQVAFPYKTVTTTTNINNVTNVKNVTTQTTTTAAQPVKGEDKPFPDDYNREVTQKAILKALDGEGIPDAKLDTSKTEQDIDAQNKSGRDAVTGITDSSLGLTNWFPNITTAQCRNPQVPNPVTGALVDVVICDKVNMFSTFISGVIAVFCVFGCVREVTSAIKA